jgi:hypothetical protein
LRAFPLVRLLQRHHACAARVQVLGEPLDRAALSGGVAALEEHHDPLTGVLDPGLHLEQLDLQGPLDDLVLVPGHPLVVGVVLLPCGDLTPVGVQEYRVVVVEFLHGPTMQAVQEVGRLQRLTQLDSGLLGMTDAAWSSTELVHGLFD